MWVVMVREGHAPVLVEWKPELGDVRLILDELHNVSLRVPWVHEVKWYSAHPPQEPRVNPSVELPTQVLVLPVRGGQFQTRQPPRVGPHRACIDM